MDVDTRLTQLVADLNYLKEQGVKVERFNLRDDDGKGGVGKTSVAIEIAQRLSRRGVSVRLTTTDPAGDLVERVASSAQLQVDRIARAYHEQRCLAELLALGQRTVLEPMHIPLISKAGL